MAIIWLGQEMRRVDLMNGGHCYIVTLNTQIDQSIDQSEASILTTWLGINQSQSRDNAAEYVWVHNQIINHEDNRGCDKVSIGSMELE